MAFVEAAEMALPKVPVFDAPYAPPYPSAPPRLAPLPPDADDRIDRLARELIDAIRSDSDASGRLDAVLREYSLSTREGLALMALAEALMRVPDADTADRLIEDKLGRGGFSGRESRSSALLIGATSWALGLSARIVSPLDDQSDTLFAMVRRLGMPAVRRAARQAIKLMGNHFILGETIDAALERAGKGRNRLFRYSFDMLGEGARTAEDAEIYRRSYGRAIAAIGRSAGAAPLPNRPGISIKLSALHPRYDPLGRSRVMTELVPVVRDLARQARSYDLNFTIDAEEAERLELSLDVVAAVLADPMLAGWRGFGLAVQAYQTRCIAIIDHLADLAARLDRQLMVRLVKGAYWDSEIKRAQERGLSNYPVYLAKGHTDLSYIAAAERLLSLRPRLFPQFATHNALTVASIVERAGIEKPGASSYEFQRLHGMGEALYAHLLTHVQGTTCRVYAPVGGHRDLLAYLVRRLLENGANSSFVAQAGDPAVPVETLLLRPDPGAGLSDPRLKAPRDLGASKRVSAPGVEFGARAELAALLAEVEQAASPSYPEALVPVVTAATPSQEWEEVTSPIDRRLVIGHVRRSTSRQATDAVSAAASAFGAWNMTPPHLRAVTLDRVADAIESERGRLIHLLQVEAGKTIEDAVSEWREAIDFCRYYAAEGRVRFGMSVQCPGPVGESNVLRLRGRGTFVAISPWNFPLAIFTGQIAAALMAGNSVVAKPAEQTPLVAVEVIRLFHAAGVPSDVLHLVIGDGDIGAQLVGDPRIKGVVFTGSMDVARTINQTLAAKQGPIAPLIAETGGINAMIVDATAQPEQVVDDVIASAFRSAGQRCSALRLLAVQDDVADTILNMIAGAARELQIGDPRHLATHIGPVIDEAAKARLNDYCHSITSTAQVVLDCGAPEGLYIGPKIFKIETIEELRDEIFGPVLHVLRYKAEHLHQLIDQLADPSHGLTLGIETRIEGLVDQVVDRLQTGNIYVNRSMIGAVVGVQPFGGSGLSGTGPKAGGPNYLIRFATEQMLTINTAAAGGDAALLTGSQPSSFEP